MRYEWDISSCNQTWLFSEHPPAIVRCFFPAGENPMVSWLSLLNRSDSTRNESENGRIGWDWGIDPSIDGHPTWHLKYGVNHGISDVFSQHDSWECLQNGTQTWFLLLQGKWGSKLELSIFRVLYGFLEQTQMGKQRDRMLLFLVAPSIPLKSLKIIAPGCEGRYIIATWCHTIEMLRVECSVWFVWPMCFLWILMGNPWSLMDAWYI